MVIDELRVGFLDILRQKLAAKIAYITKTIDTADMTEYTPEPNTDWKKWKIEAHVFEDDILRRQRLFGIYGWLECSRDNTEGAYIREDGAHYDSFDLGASADCPWHELPKDFDATAFVAQVQKELTELVQEFQNADV